MVLDPELAEFARIKEQLLSVCEGKFVLMHGKKVLGAFDTAEAAYNTGVQQFGRGPFLVKRVTRREPAFVYHALAQCLIDARL